MKTAEYLSFVVNEIHTTVVATVDDEGLPVTAAIDMMDCDENSLYFLTAKGKGFYERLIKRGFLALTAMKGKDTMSSVAVSIRGKVQEFGFERIPALFAKNPYMKEIYPTEDSMKALTAFQICEGTGEWFDFSKSRSSVPLSPSGVQHRNRKDTSLRMPVLAAEAVRRSALRTASALTAFHM